VEEAQCLFLEANRRRNSARWMLALALGLWQGETLGLRWSDVDLNNEYLKLRRNRLGPGTSTDIRQDSKRRAMDRAPSTFIRFAPGNVERSGSCAALHGRLGTRRTVAILKVRGVTASTLLPKDPGP
jgi:integrase